MENAILDIKPLLKSTSTLIKHHKQLTILKGENFNVFSILGMERAENKTHSNFIGELLNPKGSHLMGDVFLKHFLNVINDEILDPISTSVYLEYSIGPVDLENEKGGRIDILLMDDKGISISIENKIDAMDQPKQLLRYSNFNNKKNNNKVFYLTKFKRDPGEEVRGKLVEGTGYWNITYKITMVGWLEECLKEAAEKPLIRESIKQYIILIKKLTGTMNKEEEAELIKLVSGNMEAAKFIADNYESSKSSICDRFRNDVYTRLVQELSDEYSILKDQDISSNYPKIWIKHKGYDMPKVHFGIESFSGGGQRKVLFIGTFILKDEGNKYLNKYNGGNPNKYWCDREDMPDINSVWFSLSDPEFLQLIHSNPEAYKKSIEVVVNKAKCYIERYGEHVETYNTL